MLFPIVGVLIAIAVTTTMDATGLTNFSALPLLLLTGGFWFLQKPSRTEIGLRWGTRGEYGLALVYPLVVIGAVTAVVFFTGAIDASATVWNKKLINMGIGSTMGILGVMLTEEGFFRGWLWASLRSAGKSKGATLLWSSVLFMLWHVSAVTLPTGFDLPPAQVPVFLVNAAVMGLVWGLLRAVSGSIVVSSLSHAVWNALAYELFGFGTKPGALGVENTAVFGPEVGWVGLAINAIFATVLWTRLRHKLRGDSVVA